MHFIACHALKTSFILNGTGPSAPIERRGPVSENSTVRIVHAVPSALGARLPFPKDIQDAELKKPSLSSSIEIEKCGMALRDSHKLWRALTRHLHPSIGSIATEVDLVIDDRLRPHALMTPTDTAWTIAHLQYHLEKACVPRVMAYQMARSVANRFASNNAATVRLARAVAEAQDKKVRLVMRITLKPVSQLATNLKTSTVWFKTSHANVCIIDPFYKTLIMIEPTGLEFVPALASSLSSLLLGPRTDQYKVFHNYAMAAVPRSLSSLHRCTLWCAIAALIALANPVHTSMNFWRVVRWAYGHQHYLLRLFVRFCLETIDVL